MFYLVKVIELIPNEDGKIKKTPRPILVEAESNSVTIIDAAVAKDYNGVTYEWYVGAISKSPIKQVIRANGDTFGTE